MSKLLDTTGKFLLNYSRLFWGPLVIWTQFIWKQTVDKGDINVSIAVKINDYKYFAILHKTCIIKNNCQLIYYMYLLVLRSELLRIVVVVVKNCVMTYCGSVDCCELSNSPKTFGPSCCRAALPPPPQQRHKLSDAKLDRWRRLLSERDGCRRSLLVTVATCVHHGDNLFESTGRCVSVGGQQVTTIVPIVLRCLWQRENACHCHLIGGRVSTVSSLTMSSGFSATSENWSFAVRCRHYFLLPTQVRELLPATNTSQRTTSCYQHKSEKRVYLWWARTNLSCCFCCRFHCC